jgi:hypothetical protein
VTIQLTPEQLEQLRSAKASLPRLTLNADQRAEMKEAIAQEVRGRASNADKLKSLLAAEQEPGFSGSLRRAISSSQMPIAELAAAVSVDARQLDAFRTGEATLPTNVVDGLVEVLRLRLVAELASSPGL